MKHRESQLQTACVKWFRLEYPEYKLLLFAVPNGGKRNAIEASILKAEGVVAGVSDLILLKPQGDRYHGLCIEMKTDKGRQTTLQKEWQKEAERVGYKYVICRSLKDFQTEIRQYMIYHKR